MSHVRFKFSRDFDWLAPGKCKLCQLVTWAYKAGHDLLVPQAAADAAVAAGAGAIVKEVPPDA